MDKAKDFPGLVTTVLVLAVAAHFLTAGQGWVPSLPDALVHDGDAWALYMGAAGVVAVLAGFAGVIIVFGLTPGSPALAEMRTAGGRRLRANWVSLVSNPMLAALLYMLAATCALGGKASAAGWIFELAALLTAVGALRMLWLFRLLAHKNVDATPAPDAPSALELVREAERRRSAGG